MTSQMVQFGILLVIKLKSDNLFENVDFVALCVPVYIYCECFIRKKSDTHFIAQFCQICVRSSNVPTLLINLEDAGNICSSATAADFSCHVSGAPPTQLHN